MIHIPKSIFKTGIFEFSSIINLTALRRNKRTAILIFAILIYQIGKFKIYINPSKIFLKINFFGG